MVFTACDNNTITDVFLSFPQDNDDISFTQKQSVEGNKGFEYELTTQYGTAITPDDFTLWSTIDHGTSVEVAKKTDSAAGYTVNSTLPDTSVAPVGTYKLTFNYEGWTNIVNIIIEKKEVRMPHFEGMSGEPVYTGEDYTQKIVYDTDVVNMLDDSERIYPIGTPAEYDSRYYNVEFELKDKDNYRWEDPNLGSENYTFRFEINKRQLRLDVSNYLRIDTSDVHYVAENDIPTLKYDLRENYPKTLEDILALSSVTVNGREISEFADLVELKLIQIPYGEPVAVDGITAAGTYYLTLAVKDSRCDTIGTITQTSSLMSRIDILIIRIV